MLSVGGVGAFPGRQPESGMAARRHSPFIRPRLPSGPHSSRHASLRGRKLPRVPTLRLWSWRLSPFAGNVRVAFAEEGMEVELSEADRRARRPRLRELP